MDIWRPCLPDPHPTLTISCPRSTPFARRMGGALNLDGSLTFYAQGARNLSDVPGFEPNGNDPEFQPTREHRGVRACAALGARVARPMQCKCAFAANCSSLCGSSKAGTFVFPLSAPLLISCMHAAPRTHRHDCVPAPCLPAAACLLLPACCVADARAAPSPTPGYPLGMPLVYSASSYIEANYNMRDALPLPDGIKWCGDSMPRGGVKTVTAAWIMNLKVRMNRELVAGCPICLQESDVAGIKLAVGACSRSQTARG